MAYQGSLTQRGEPVASCKLLADRVVPTLSGGRRVVAVVSDRAFAAGESVELAGEPLRVVQSLALPRGGHALHLEEA